MNLSLPHEIEQLILRKVESGQYPTASEVLREALQLLDERDRLREMRIAELREAIQVGIEQADRGEVIDGPIVFDRFRERLREREGQES